MSWLDDLLYGYRTIRDAALADAPARAILKIVGATVTDDPATGATVITIAEGTPLATLTGAGFVHVDSSDAQNPVVSLSPAPTTTATPDRLVVRDGSGQAFATYFYASGGFIGTASGTLEISQATAIAGNGANGLVKAQSGTQSGNRDGGTLNLSGGDGHGTGIDGGAALQVAEVTVFRVGVEAGLGGAKVAYLGASGSPAGLLIPGDCTTCEIMWLDRADAGNGRNLNFSGQTASNGNGGSIQFNTGSKGGGGTLDGEMHFGVGGRELLQLASGVAIVGDNTNVTTPSVHLHGPVGTTVGAAGGASALPATPTKYLQIIVNGITYVSPLYTAL